MGTAPAGTASVRVLAAMLDGVNNVNPQQSAFWDDFSLVVGSAGLLADEDGDNDVDGNDLVLLQRIDPARIAAWQSEYGQGIAAAAAGNVPEPASWLLVLVAGSAVAGRRRR